MQGRTASGSLASEGSPGFLKNLWGSLNMQCREFRDIADSYLGNELIVETNHEVISHLEHCSECRCELAARRELRSQLREAFIKAPQNQMSEHFVQRLTPRLHDQPFERS